MSWFFSLNSIISLPEKMLFTRNDLNYNSSKIIFRIKFPRTIFVFRIRIYIWKYLKKSVVLIKSYTIAIQFNYAFKMAYPHNFLAENYLMVDENDTARFKLLDIIPVIYKNMTCHVYLYLTSSSTTVECPWTVANRDETKQTFYLN